MNLKSTIILALTTLALMATGCAQRDDQGNPTPRSFSLGGMVSPGCAGDVCSGGGR